MEAADGSEAAVPRRLLADSGDVRRRWEEENRPVRREQEHVMVDLLICAVILTAASCALPLSWARTRLQQHNVTFSLWEGLPEMIGDPSPSVSNIATATTVFLSIELAAYCLYMPLAVGAVWLPVAPVHGCIGAGRNNWLVLAVRYGWLVGALTATVVLGLVLGTAARYRDAWSDNLCTGNFCDHRRTVGFWAGVVAGALPLGHAALRLWQDGSLPNSPPASRLRPRRERAQRALLKQRLAASDCDDDLTLHLRRAAVEGCCCSAAAAVVHAAAEGVVSADLSGQGCRPVTAAGRSPVRCAVVGGGNVAVTTGDGKAVRFWRAPAGPDAQPPLQLSGRVVALCAGSDGGVVCGLASDQIVVAMAGTTEPDAQSVVSTATSQKVASITAVPSAGSAPLVYWCSGDDSAVWMWAAAGRGPTVCWTAPRRQTVSCVASAPAVPAPVEVAGVDALEPHLWGGRVYAGCTDGVVRAFGCTGTAAMEQEIGAAAAAVSCVDANGEGIAVGHRDGAVVLYRRDGWPLSYLRPDGSCSALHLGDEALCAVHTAGDGAVLSAWGLPEFYQKPEPASPSVRRRWRAGSPGPSPTVKDQSGPAEGAAV
eukprot:TRINITY_DN28805_c0_g1_i1.p1 TRINITY_DN28805_c0_g1~~TRINITY_DN28805_c0_g1_i1.p1  ORF type:complete len:615 (+),score=182.70 TRINITY_DN28805_c0_g1_i1:55-1845(+)